MPSVLSVGALRAPSFPAATAPLSAVTQFQQVAQGGSGNNATTVTSPQQQTMLVWAPPAGGLPVGGHYQTIVRTDDGADVDGPTTTNNWIVLTGLTNMFNPTNIGQGGSFTIGPTTRYDFDVVVVDAIGNRSAKPLQFTLFHFRGGISGTATSGSSSSLGDSGASWATNQWLGYYVFYGNSGTDFPTSRTTPVAVCVGNTANTLTLVNLDGSTLSPAVAAGNAYQIGGDYFTGVGDVSFGDSPGDPHFTTTSGSPIAPHAFCLGMTFNPTEPFTMGLQRPSADPAGFIYGLEVGAYNYATWKQRPAVNGQATEFAIHHRCPTGDLPGPPWKNIDSTAILAYGPTALANTWQSYFVPYSAVLFTTPLGGVTTFSASITSGTMSVTGINSGPGLDSGMFFTGTGVPAGAYISANSGGQSGAGTYAVLKNNGAAVGNVGSFTDGRAYGTNSYKWQIKVTGSSNQGNTTYYDDIASVRSNSLPAGA